MNRVVPVAVEPMPLEAHGGELRVRDGDAAGILAAIEFRSDAQARTGCRVDPMRLTIVAKSTSGVPRQFMAMCENRRCSILFHLLVPGGK